jgi:hypothetical protein
MQTLQATVTVTKLDNPWTLEQRSLIASAINEALETKLEASSIIGVVIVDNRAYVVWNGDGVRQSFYFDKADFRAMLDAQRLKIVQSVFARRSLTVRILASESDKQTFVIRDRSGAFLGIVTARDNSWSVTRASGNGYPLPVSSLDDAALSIWMLEVGAIA